MMIRDEKETIHDYIFRERLPYTIIDVGYWYALSIFPLPSGKLDYVISYPRTEIVGDGNAPNMIIDKEDIGRFVARIISDPRTLNKRVAACGSQLSQNQIRDIMERLSGEKLALTNVSRTSSIATDAILQATYKNSQVTNEEAIKRRDEAKADRDDFTDFKKMVAVVLNQYNVSKYIRQDNTIENAGYLGYVNARELYPDFSPKSFEQYVQEAIDGKALRPYPNLNI